MRLDEVLFFSNPLNIKRKLYKRIFFYTASTTLLFLETPFKAICDTDFVSNQLLFAKILLPVHRQ